MDDPKAMPRLCGASSAEHICSLAYWFRWRHTPERQQTTNVTPAPANDSPSGSLSLDVKNSKMEMVAGHLCPNAFEKVKHYHATARYTHTQTQSSAHPQTIARKPSQRVTVKRSLYSTLCYTSYLFLFLFTFFSSSTCVCSHTDATNTDAGWCKRVRRNQST